MCFLAVVRSSTRQGDSNREVNRRHYCGSDSGVRAVSSVTMDEVDERDEPHTEFIYCCGAATELLKFGARRLTAAHKLLFLVIPGWWCVDVVVVVVVKLTSDLSYPPQHHPAAAPHTEWRRSVDVLLAFS